jgi:hypothetical protein
MPVCNGAPTFWEDEGLLFPSGGEINVGENNGKENQVGEIEMDEIH